MTQRLLLTLLLPLLVLVCLADEEQEQVCVTLLHYGSSPTASCHGHPQSTRRFTALTKPGSPCKHTALMQGNSVKDQYCKISTAGDDEEDSAAVFYQTVYVHNKRCHVGFAQKAFSPQKLHYTTKHCTYGYKLQSCTPGQCNGDNEDWHGLIAEVA